MTEPRWIYETGYSTPNVIESGDTRTFVFKTYNEQVALEKATSKDEPPRNYLYRYYYDEKGNRVAQSYDPIRKYWF